MKYFYNNNGKAIAILDESETLTLVNFLGASIRIEAFQKQSIYNGGYRSRMTECDKATFLKFATENDNVQLLSFLEALVGKLTDILV
jgi:hypothetical protein